MKLEGTSSVCLLTGSNTTFNNGSTFFLFSDTACNYQNEQSEAWIGEWMEARGNRDEMVIATKFTTNYRQHALVNTNHGIAANYGGNHTKALQLSVRDSLKKLRTEDIDILYVYVYLQASHSLSLT